MDQSPVHGDRLYDNAIVSVQTTCFPANGILRRPDDLFVFQFKAGAEGLEPATAGFGNQCSAN